MAHEAEGRVLPTYRPSCKTKLRFTAATTTSAARMSSCAARSSRTRTPYHRRDSSQDAKREENQRAKIDAERTHRNFECRPIEKHFSEEIAKNCDNYPKREICQDVSSRHRSAHNIDGSTRSGGLWPSMKVRMLTITFSPMSMRPSTVAEPMCGKADCSWRPWTPFHGAMCYVA